MSNETNETGELMDILRKIFKVRPHGVSAGPDAWWMTAHGNKQSVRVEEKDRTEGAVSVSVFDTKTGRRKREAIIRSPEFAVELFKVAVDWQQDQEQHQISQVLEALR